MNSAIVEGTRVHVGDVVGFKSDIEQSGTISHIKRDMMGNVLLTLTDEDGFHGDYIGGSTVTTELASDCWVD